MKFPALLLGTLLCGMSLTIPGCTTPVSEPVANASSVPLTNTNWRLTRLGELAIANSESGNAVGLLLQSENPRVTGFSGCNRMFGGYSINGEALKFDQLGGTKMACLDAGRMQLEQTYFDMLMKVARWKITGSTLALLDDSGVTLATFAAAPPAP